MRVVRFTSQLMRVVLIFFDKKLINYNPLIAPHRTHTEHTPTVPTAPTALSIMPKNAKQIKPSSEDVKILEAAQNAAVRIQANPVLAGEYGITVEKIIEASETEVNGKKIKTIYQILVFLVMNDITKKQQLFNQLVADKKAADAQITNNIKFLETSLEYIQSAHKNGHKVTIEISGEISTMRDYIVAAKGIDEEIREMIEDNPSLNFKIGKRDFIKLEKIISDLEKALSNSSEPQKPQMPAIQRQETTPSCDVDKTETETETKTVDFAAVAASGEAADRALVEAANLASAQCVVEAKEKQEKIERVSAFRKRFNSKNQLSRNIPFKTVFRAQPVNDPTKDFSTVTQNGEFAEDQLQKCLSKPINNSFKMLNSLKKGAGENCLAEFWNKITSTEVPTIVFDKPGTYCIAHSFLAHCVLIVDNADAKIFVTFGGDDQGVNVPLFYSGHEATTHFLRGTWVLYTGHFWTQWNNKKFVQNIAVDCVFSPFSRTFDLKFYCSQHKNHSKTILAGFNGVRMYCRNYGGITKRIEVIGGNLGPIYVVTDSLVQITTTGGSVGPVTIETTADKTQSADAINVVEQSTIANYAYMRTSVFAPTKVKFSVKNRKGCGHWESFADVSMISFEKTEEDFNAAQRAKNAKKAKKAKKNRDSTSTCSDDSGYRTGEEDAHAEYYAYATEQSHDDNYNDNDTYQHYEYSTRA